MSSAAKIDPYKYPYISLKNGQYSAEIATYGGGLRSCEYREQPILESYPRGEIPPLSSNIILAPWPNRTADGQFTFQDNSFQLNINEPDRNNAIHGFAHEQRWDVKKATEDYVLLGCILTSEKGWPWRLELTAEYKLSDTGLRVLFEVTNLGAEAAPFALGIHTYLALFGAPVDDYVLSVPVDSHLELDPERLLPTGTVTALVDEPQLADLPHGLTLDGMLLDDCFHATDHSTVDRVTVLHHRNVDVEKRKVVMHTSPNLPWFQIFTADPTQGNAYPGRGRALAVEPMSAPPNALRSGMDLLTLQPGETQQFYWGVAIAE